MYTKGGFTQPGTYAIYFMRVVYIWLKTIFLLPPKLMFLLKFTFLPNSLWQNIHLKVAHKSQTGRVLRKGIDVSSNLTF